MTSVVEFWGQGSTGSRFLLKNHSKKYCFDLTSTDFQMSCQKVPKSHFQSQSSIWKTIWSFFFSLKNVSLSERFLLILTLWFLIWCPIFDDSFESQWKSNKKTIFLELILSKDLLQVDPCPRNSTSGVTLTRICPFKAFLEKLG